MSSKINNYTVYKHTSPSGKVYIGITNRDPIKRWGTNGMYYKGSHKFYNAILKYGWDNIKHEILYTNLSADEAKSKEIELISHYKAFDISYNITNGGDGSLGLFPSEETRKKIGEKSKGRTPNIETRKKISESIKALHLTRSDETKRKISEKNKGKKRTKEQIERNRKTHIGFKKSQESIEKQRLKIIGRVRSQKEIQNLSRSLSIPVVQLTKEGNFVAFWESSKVAAQTMGYSHSKIIACCKGKIVHSNGYIWRYLSSYEPII